MTEERNPVVEAVITDGVLTHLVTEGNDHKSVTSPVHPIKDKIYLHSPSASAVEQPVFTTIFNWTEDLHSPGDTWPDLELPLTAIPLPPGDYVAMLEVTFPGGQAGNCDIEVGTSGAYGYSNTFTLPAGSSRFAQAFLLSSSSDSETCYVFFTPVKNITSLSLRIIKL